MISVIIPAYNAEKTIHRCLSALEDQTIPRQGYEVLVVDDGSTDKTAEIIKTFPMVVYSYQKNAGPAAARNDGAKKAQGEIILFTDSDCEPCHDWIEQMLVPFSDPRTVGAKGVYQTKQMGIVAKFVQLEYESKYDRLQKYKQIDFIDTYSAGFRKDKFLELGGYDLSFPVACAEDVELSFRMSARGWGMVFQPAAVVYHQHPDRLMWYLQKKYKFAYWRMLAVKKNPDKIRNDSHTPQCMKVQLLLSPAIVVLLVGSILFQRYFWFWSAAGLFVLISFPIALKGFRRYGVGMFLYSFFVLYLRGLFQFSGVLKGTINALKGRHA